MSRGGVCRTTRAGTTAGESPSPRLLVGTVPMIALYAVLGFVAGIAHRASLRGNARLWVEGARWQALSLQAVRFAVAASLLVVVWHAGIWPLALATAGFALASAAATLWQRLQVQ